MAERIEFRNARGLRLVGELSASEGRAIVVLAHGFTSDRHSRGRFPKLSEALARVGIATLAFDFAGCGESDDDALSISGQVDDLRAAFSFVRARGFERVGVLGHSLGGLIALSAFSPEVDALVLTGAPTGPMRYDWAALYGAEAMRELAETSRMTLTREDPARPRIVVERSLLEAFGEIDPRSLLEPIERPVLLIHGDGDSEERALLANARRALELLCEGSRLEVIPGAPHGFGDSYDQVIALATAWFVEKLEA